MKIKNTLSAILALSLTVGILSSSAFAEEVFYENFENLTVGETPTSIGGAEQDSLTSYAKIVYDEENQTNVLRLGKAANNGSYVYETINLGKEYTSGVYVISYKLRAKNHGAHAVRFMSPSNSVSGSYGTYDNLIGMNYWFNHTASQGTALAMGPDLSDDGTYLDISAIIDLNNKKYTTTATKNGSSNTYSNQDLKVDSVSTLKTMFAANNAHSVSGDKSKDSEYYVDDIKIEHFPVSVVDKTENELITDVSQDIVIKFDKELSGISASNVEIYTDGSSEKISKSLYQVKYFNKKLTIRFYNGLRYGTSYEVKLGAGVKAAEAKYDPMLGSVISSFYTPDIFENVLSVADGGNYNEPHKLTVTTDLGYEVKLKKDGSDIEFTNAMELTKGEYSAEVKMWKLTDTADIYTKTVNFTVWEATAPVFEKLEISGKPIVGETLSIDYKFVDYNGDPEGKSEFYWLKSSDGVNFEQASDKLTYTLTKDDIDCYFKLEAYPVSTVEPVKGEKHESEVFTGPFKPTVDGDVTLSLKDTTLTASYKYSDKNGYDEKDSEISWYRMKSKTASPVKISGATGTSYTFTDDDIDCYVYCSVIPKKEFEPKTGDEYKSALFACLKKPVAKNVKIVGNATVGNSLSVSFTYEDEENDPEGKHIIEWFVGGNLYETDKEAIKLTSSMAGKEVYCRITPVSQNFPKQGDPVSTDKKTVSKVTSSSGSGSVSSKNNSGVSVGAGSYEDNNVAAPIIIPEEKTFSDMENHWAEENVKRAVKLGFVNGKSEDEFAPDLKITRAEFAAIIARILNLEKKSAKYLDISEDMWYNEYVGAVSEAGYMSGFDGYFRPDDNITREEMCQVIFNITGASEKENEETLEFSDKDEISDWAENAVKGAYKLGLMTGRDDGRFSPKESSTRAEATSAILRLYDYIEEEK